MEVKGKLVSNFMFQFVSPSFTGNTDFTEGIWGDFSQRLHSRVISRNDRGIMACSVVRLGKRICQHSML